jgi:hypothetical protein
MHAVGGRASRCSDLLHCFRQGILFAGETCYEPAATYFTTGLEPAVNFQ